MSENLSPKKILLLSANPVGTEKRRLDEEIRDIQEGLFQAKNRDNFVLDSIWATRHKDIRRAILRVQPNIIHFSGHGSKEGGLAFEDESGGVKILQASALAGLFSLIAESVECVVLNACYSEPQAQAIAKHIDFVVGMKKDIGNRAAIEFSVGFYDALCSGLSIEKSYEFGCNAIQLAGLNENLTPVLKRKNAAPTEEQDRDDYIAITNSLNEVTQTPPPHNYQSLSEFSLLNKPQMENSYSKAQADYQRILTNNKARLKDVIRHIESSGGVTECPTYLVKEFTQLREEIDNLNKILSNLNLPPSNIPAAAQFIDRPRERERLESALRSTEDWVRIVVVKGMGGTGKTALAVQVARTVTGAFTKVIWTTANDDQSITLENLLDIILRAVDYPSDQLTMQQRKAKVSELLRKDRYLLVLDSFERFGDRAIDEFLAHNDFWPSKVLITTRVIFPEDAYTTELKGLTFEQTKQMLEEVGESKGITVPLSEKEIRGVHDITSGLPLAVELIIGQLAQGISLRNVLDALMSGLTSDGLLEPLFGRSWDLLKENDRIAHEIWMSMTFFVAPASEEAIREINKISIQEFVAAIAQLNKMSLIQPGRDRIGGDEFRYRLHPMARQFLDAKLIE
ncbi:MAG: NB-ARC domain-containing protein, partial [Cyanobacteria bacterium P01_F01_bin.53]